MIVYRISNQKTAKYLLGKGAALYGGRWNSIGVPLLYTASSISLAYLEILVHTRLENFPSNYGLVKIEIPDDILITSVDKSFLPASWNKGVINEFTRKIGDNWIENNLSLALKVPSAIVPEEYDFLINTRHARFSEIAIREILALDMHFQTASISISQKESVPDPEIVQKIKDLIKFEFEIFISHAKEDYDLIVYPLIQEISQYGFRYWHYKEQIRVGESINQKISKGINSSRFILAIITPTYLSKLFAFTELEAGINIQLTENRVIILPVIAGNDAVIKEFHGKFVMLRDKRYLQWNDNPKEIIQEIARFLLMP